MACDSRGLWRLFPDTSDYLTLQQLIITLQSVSQLNGTGKTKWEEGKKDLHNVDKAKL